MWNTKRCSITYGNLINLMLHIIEKMQMFKVSVTWFHSSFQPRGGAVKSDVTGRNDLLWHQRNADSQLRSAQSVFSWVFLYLREMSPHHICKHLCQLQWLCRSLTSLPLTDISVKLFNLNESNCLSLSDDLVSVLSSILAIFHAVLFLQKVTWSCWWTPAYVNTLTLSLSIS